MLRVSAGRLFKVGAPQDVRGVAVRGAAAPQRRRQFTQDESGRADRATGSAGKGPVKHTFIPPGKPPHGARVGRVVEDEQLHRVSPFPDGSSYTAPEANGDSTSQRQRYRQQHTSNDGGEGGSNPAAPASLLSPFPKKYGFYDGIDEHALEPARPSPALRQRMMRQALEEQAASVVEFTDGGENDIDLGGLPASEYHGQQGWTTIPRDSALYSSVFAAQELESRQRSNSWTVARRRGGQESLVGAAAEQEANKAGPEDNKENDADASAPDVLDDARRRRHHDEGGYTNVIEGELLEPIQESIGQPRSVYGLRKMYIKGLVGYHGIISRAEEAQIAEELMHLLQDPRAAYIAEETRYCVNLYETELGVPGKDTLAFPIACAPTLQRVLFRVFFLGLIPAPPNVVQVSEMIGNFSGYPVHRKPRAVGSYVGLLNLVSATVMHLQHVDCPWYPRLHINPRSLFVISEPCLSEYGMGYKQTHQPFHAFEYATRVSKDYRIEVLFATVETEHMKHLNEAVQLTEYAHQRQQQQQPQLTSSSADATGPGAPSATSSSTRIDGYLERLRHRMHDPTEGTASDDPSAAGPVVVDGNLLRKQLQERGLVGQKAHSFSVRPSTSEDATRATGDASPSSSAAQRRLAALKARHDFAKRLKSESVVSRDAPGGPRLIRGHAPGDNRGW